MRLSKEEYKEVLKELKLLKKSIESVNYNYNLTDIIIGDIIEQINDEIEQIKQFIKVAI